MRPESVPEAFREGCLAAGIEPSHGTVIVGISGGRDSMVLGHLLMGAGFDIEVAHVNYGLRPESTSEEEYVRAWCLRHDVTCHALGPSNLNRPGSGLQAWARDVRYGFFADVASTVEAATVAVAHHADDQLETLLLNLERGTGPAGLVGMVPSRPLFRDSPVDLVRPLLGMTGEGIRGYATQAGLHWMDDSSNQSDAYARNVLRSELASMEAGDLAAFREAGLHLSSQMRMLRQYLIQTLGDDSRLRFEDLDVLPSWMREWCVLEWLTLHAPTVPRRRTMAAEVLSLQSLQTGRRVDHAPYTVWKERDGFRVTQAQDHESVSFSLPPEGTTESIAFGHGHLIVETIRNPTADQPTRGATEVVLDASVLGEGLHVRAWQAGERFRPPGLDGRKKVKSFLTDRKVAPSRRAGIPVLADHSGILWVVGHEIDARARLESAAMSAVRMRWVPEEEDPD